MYRPVFLFMDYVGFAITPTLHTCILRVVAGVSGPGAGCCCGPPRNQVMGEAPSVDLKSQDPQEKSRPFAPLVMALCIAYKPTHDMGFVLTVNFWD